MTEGPLTTLNLKGWPGRPPYVSKGAAPADSGVQTHAGAHLDGRRKWRNEKGRLTLAHDLTSRPTKRKHVGQRHMLHAD